MIVAEKPSVARDLAQALGVKSQGQGYYKGHGYLITWSIGHLVALPEPHEINERWKKWIPYDLPILPESWPLQVIEKTRGQFQVIERLLQKKEVQEVICATDAGREGELIFRYIYEKLCCQLPVKRLWISSLTSEAIKEGFRNLRSGKDFESLGFAAKARSRSDWLVGMNLSRAYSLRFSENYSVGRVQTPTLAMLAKRENEISNFKPEDYWLLKVDFQLPAPTKVLEKLSLFRPSHRRFKDLKTKDYKAYRFDTPNGQAESILKSLEDAEGQIVWVSGKETRQKSPLLYDLTELQRKANRRFGLSAAETLKIAQSLYEKHKLISYPRTDSRYLSETVADSIQSVADSVAGPFSDQLLAQPSDHSIPRRFVDDSKCTEHHALIPTGKAVTRSLTENEARIYDLIVRRLLAAWQPDFVSRTSYVVLEALLSPLDHELFFSRGVQVLQWGFKEIEGERGMEEKRLRPLPESIDMGVAGSLLKPVLEKRTTTPPPRMNDASLLTAMETAGRSLADKELRSLMHEQGLGTAATRAGIIDTLLARKYLQRHNNAFHVTDKGLALIAAVDPEVKTPKMTAEWEGRLRDIERGKLDFSHFMRQIEGYVSKLVDLAHGEQKIPNQGQVQNTSLKRTLLNDPIEKRKEKMKCSSDLDFILQKNFGFSSFREHQKEVCQEVYNGTDLLLVMPTGAGKSLCYQLPGLAREGVTLVVSPLIALIEDQVCKLKNMGLKAERIHSGLGRAHSMNVCRAYVSNSLDFLFVAPERLGIQGFLNLLAQHKPNLVAIDEAHCISQWGHDFRPDYRLLRERLACLRPAPIIALTATATPLVQDDIKSELGLLKPSLHIHGFRRTNIAIEAVEMPVNRRPDALTDLLSDASRRPAIIYTSSRSMAEDVAARLPKDFNARAYHAGMFADDRNRTQDEFLSGHTDIIAATIAFGMGVDKADIRTVVHMALPSTVEGYYQEIGRAGRDGLPSKAILFHSFADYRTQDWFLNRNYPEVEFLQSLVAKVPAEGILKSHLSSSDDPDLVENAIEKLWIHGGLDVSPEEFITLGDTQWVAKYKAQRDHRIEQSRQMGKLAKSHDVCRMLMLIQYFGDKNDSREPCGRCDICSPEESFFSVARSPNATEMVHLEYLLSYLYDRGSGLSKGKVFREVFECRGVTKDVFEAWTAALVTAGFIRLVEDSFQKGQRTISYWKMELAPGFRPINIAWEKVRIPDFGQELKSAEKKRKGAVRAKTKVRRRVDSDHETNSIDQGLLERLKKWRLAEARKKKIPAFCILPDRSVNQIAQTKPKNEEDLLGISGIGPGKLKKYATPILNLVNQ